MAARQPSGTSYAHIGGSTWHFRDAGRERRSTDLLAATAGPALVPSPELGLNEAHEHRRRANRAARNMIDPKSLDALVARIAEGLPAGFGQVHEDLRNNLHAAVSAARTRMDLVSRDEFDVQSAVVARTREKLTALEAKVGELERALDADQEPPNPKRGS